MMKILAGAAFLLAAGSASAVDNYTFKGNQAYGYASGNNSYECDYDPNGNGDGSYECVYAYSYANVDGYSSVTHVPGGAPANGSYGWQNYGNYVETYGYDATADAWHYNYSSSGGYGNVTGFQSNRLNSATVTGTVTSFNYSYDSSTGEYVEEVGANAPTSAVFTGAGATYNGKQMNSYRSPTGFFRSRSTGSNREATFTFTVNGANVIPADSYQYGYLLSTNGGTIAKYDGGTNGHVHP